MRYLDAAARRPVDRPPVWLMRQAGRYLPEYRKVRSRVGFQEAIRRPDVAAEITLQPMVRFPLDAAIVFKDIMTPLEAMGVDVTFDPGPVLARPLRDASELSPLEPATGVPFVLETLRLVRKALAPDRALVGFCGGPFTLAAYLLEGGAGRDFRTIRTAAAADPTGLRRLLDRLADAMADYLGAQFAAGADAVQIFDSWAGIASTGVFADVVVPALERLLDRLAAPGPVTYFAPGGPHLLALAGNLAVDVVGIDWRLPVSAARVLLGERAVQGNVDPAVLFAGPDAARGAVDALLADAGSAPGLIVNVGHGLLPGTPVEAVAAFVDEVVRRGR